ncbi:MAG: hypothetical protein K2L13_03885 [Opitutales bacterium]|nr:hypothetical protein [Opitutales bacterium]
MSKPTENKTGLGTDPLNTVPQGAGPNGDINVANKQDQKPLLPPTQIGDGQSSLSSKTCDPNSSKPGTNEAHDQDADKPASAKREKSNGSNSSLKSSQPSKANQSSEIDTTPAAGKEASPVQQLQNLPEEPMERERDYEAEIKETKSKTAKTVLVLAASGLAIGGAAVACLILLPALPIYACGLLGVAIGAAIGLLILAIASGILGRDERKGLEAQRAQQLPLSDPTAPNIDNNEQINAQ